MGGARLSKSGGRGGGVERTYSNMCKLLALSARIAALPPGVGGGERADLGDPGVEERLGEDSGEGVGGERGAGVGKLGVDKGDDVGEWLPPVYGTSPALRRCWGRLRYSEMRGADALTRSASGVGGVGGGMGLAEWW